MRWLLWKEYRVNRVIAFVLLFLMILPHVIAAYVALRYAHRGVRWEVCLTAAGVYSFLLSQVALALIGGNAFAGERADRSAEFQVYLPITRGKILAGKLLLALAIAAVIWLTNPPLLWGLLHTVAGSRPGVAPWQNPQDLLQFFSNTAITGLTFFCVAWLFSSFLASPTFSVSAGLVAPMLVGSGISYITYLLDMPESMMIRILEAFYRGICLTIAPVCFAVGTWLYLRRVEP